MLRFDLSAYYSLLEVFDRTGRLMFPQDWTGEEAWSRDTENPDEIKEQRKELFAKITSLQNAMAPLHALMAMDLSDSEFQETSDNLGALNTRMKEAKIELAQLPQVSDTWVADHASFSRRIAVEKELTGAFKNGELRIIVGTHLVVPWNNWCQCSDFRVSYALSMVRIPKDESALRRGPAFVQKSVYDVWTQNLPETEPLHDTTNAREVLTAWLKLECEKHPKKPMKRDEYLLVAQKHFKPLTISRALFRLVWSDVVPDDWKSAGAPRKNNSAT
ncbi:hypothetical protein [Celeribacter naphthalenivorans]|uniref:hypothetical protein n=1 Tax=Celeribacter naphthalenivorans TaxID=1614694 RepID=UPI001CFB98B7|nr:hypothetical protein [Celeribacter naphthalenivorans]